MASKTMIVEDHHFDYLRLQKGALQMFDHDREAWQIAYEQALAKDFSTMKPHLPKSCSAILDVGGGLGGIDALLVKHFGKGCAVTILDGENDPPVMHLHRKTFNDMTVTQDFLVKNGVEKFDYFTPQKQEVRPFDLIISLGSWCFHYEPNTYLDLVRSCCHAGTVIILDVRKEKWGWTRQLRDAFGNPVAIIHDAKKRDRVVFHA